MLKTEMIDKLNEQMNLELYSSLLYQQMSAWCSYHSFALAKLEQFLTQIKAIDDLVKSFDELDTEN
ncbi:hypothetical protein MJL33_30500 [Salmonella enterica subsp. enterica serovar Kentucky]|nr:hypothetical protein [Salmonella enterica subsp. enterica serovar Kentucky]